MKEVMFTITTVVKLILKPYHVRFGREVLEWWVPAKPLSVLHSSYNMAWLMCTQARNTCQAVLPSHLLAPH
jgi:hypothetical protein